MNDYISDTIVYWNNIVNYEGWYSYYLSNDKPKSILDNVRVEIYSQVLIFASRCTKAKAIDDIIGSEQSFIEACLTYVQSFNLVHQLLPALILGANNDGEDQSVIDDLNYQLTEIINQHEINTALIISLIKTM